MGSHEVTMNVTVLVNEAEDETEAAELAIHVVEFAPTEEVVSCFVFGIRETGGKC